MGTAGSLGAHPISLTSALVDVREEAVNVEIRMMVEDLILYYRMESDGDLRFPVEALRKQAEAHAGFFLRHLHLRDREGTRLEGEAAGINFSELPEKGVHFDDLMAYSIYFQFIYPFAERPEFLTVGQDFGGDEPPVPAEMRARIFHHGVLMDAAVLSHGTAHTVPLDWEAGWERAREDVEGARERLRRRREETLGITSYSAVYSFIYVTRDEVRHELLAPLLTMEDWLPLQREDPEVLTVDEQRAAREGIEAFLRRHSRVTLDGVDVPPELERLQFFGPEIQDFARQAPERDVSVFNARVGVILSYPARKAPRNLAFSWDFFADRLPRLRSMVYLFEESSQEAVFTPFQTLLTWEVETAPPPPPLADIPPLERQPPLRLPLVAVIAGGLALVAAGTSLFTRQSRGIRAGFAAAAVLLTVTALSARTVALVEVEQPFRTFPAVAEAEAKIVFGKLHRNLYRAFDHRDEEGIYDVLDRTVAGPLLEEIYLQIRRGLQMEEQGGAVSRIRDVELTGVALDPAVRPARRGAVFSVLATWNVTGTVEHWGHIHTRTNRYEARFTVEGRESGWRITGFDPLIEERVGMRIALRR